MNHDPNYTDCRIANQYPLSASFSPRNARVPRISYNHENKHDALQLVTFGSGLNTHGMYRSDASHQVRPVSPTYRAVEVGVRTVDRRTSSQIYELQQALRTNQSDRFADVVMNNVTGRRATDKGVNATTTALNLLWAEHPGQVGRKPAQTALVRNSPASLSFFLPRTIPWNPKYHNCGVRKSVCRKALGYRH